MTMKKINTFFLSQYFYESYDQAMNPELLPIISSGINITKIEVYVTNKNSTTVNTRNILALQDLGEHSAINPINGLLEDNNTPFPYVPDNLNNSLNPFDFVAEAEPVTFNYVYSSVEYTGYTCSVFNDIFGAPGNLFAKALDLYS